MATTRKYHGIHRQQLFHWLGSPKDRSTGLKGKLSSEARQEYVSYLRGSLENGIWVKSPRDPESLRLGSFNQPLDKAMACFTEWSLNESQPHTTEYGRMGLGFAKSWLIEHGGQPVTYFDHSAKGAFLKNLVSLLKRLSADPAALDEFLFLVHFSKRIHKSPAKPTVGKVQKKAKAAARKTAAAPKVPDPFQRFWSKTMPYLEEREWRVVEHPSLVKKGHLVPGPATGTPKFYLPYQPGEELFTLVLPDNQTVNEVLRTTWFTNRLFPKAAPHVTVLSLQDIGTF
jgi:hypothetical protein